MEQSPASGGLHDSGRFIQDTLRRALLPALLSIGGVMASTLVNGLIAGNLLGQEALAVLSLVTPIYSVFATIGSLAGSGASSLAAWCVGRDDREGCNAVVTFSAWLSLGLSLILTVLGLLFLDPLLGLLGTSAELWATTRQYLLFYLFSGIGVAGIYPPYFLLKLDGRHRLSMGLFLCLAAVCVGAELFCVLALDMGLAGVALGFTIANLGTALMGWICLLGKGSSFRLCATKRIWALAPQLLAAGSPAALNNLCSVLRSVSLNLLIVGLAGKLGLSAFSVVTMAGNLALIFINGLSQTISPFVGVFTSERDFASLQQIRYHALRLGLALILPVTVLLLLFVSPFCRLFGISDPDSLVVVAAAVRIFALSLPFSMVSTLLMYYYLAARRTWLANLLTICRSYLLLVLCARLLSRPLGLNGVWLAFSVAEVASWLVLAVALAVFHRRNPNLRGILLLDRRYEQDGRYISFSVHSTVEEIMDASQRISVFCGENHLDSERSMLISLSLEEMLMSIKDHCFAHDEGQDINVRILIAPSDDGKQSTVLRIRCSGTPFNPIAYYEQHRQAQPEGELDLLDDLLDGLDDSLGIAMIVSTASMVDYKTTFGVNNLTIHL